MFYRSMGLWYTTDIMKKHFKTLLAGIILVATILVFWRYIQTHPAIIDQLRHTPPSILIPLVALYIVWWVALAATLQISLRMYHKTMPVKENMLLSAYSSLLNFFGPGQSGPGLRAIYLKKRHNMRVKDYIFATLLYYACYAVISAAMFFVGSRPWWQTTLLVLMAGGGSFAVLKWYARRSKLHDKGGVNIVTLSWLFGATAVQLLAQFAIYFIELHAINPAVGVGQALAYTGAANFALFVALTPGAIGIREAFLVFTQGIHHLGNGIIVAANVIDRAVYLLFLGLLFVLVFTMHAGQKLGWRQITREAEKQAEAEPQGSPPKQP